MTQKNNEMIIFMKNFIDTWKLLDSFENTKVEIRLTQWELENRVEVCISQSTYNIYLLEQLCFNPIFL